MKLEIKIAFQGLSSVGPNLIPSHENRRQAQDRKYVLLGVH